TRPLARRLSHGGRALAAVHPDGLGTAARALAVASTVSGLRFIESLMLAVHEFVRLVPGGAPWKQPAPRAAADPAEVLATRRSTRRSPCSATACQAASGRGPGRTSRCGTPTTWSSSAAACTASRPPTI